MGVTSWPTQACTMPAEAMVAVVTLAVATVLTSVVATTAAATALVAAAAMTAAKAVVHSVGIPWNSDGIWPNVTGRKKCESSKHQNAL
jgi:hypothetical protein